MFHIKDNAWTMLRWNQWKPNSAKLTKQKILK